MGDSFRAGRKTPGGKLAVAIAGKLVMRPLWAASDVNRSEKDLDLSRILTPGCFHFHCISLLCGEYY